MAVEELVRVKASLSDHGARASTLRDKATAAGKGRRGKPHAQTLAIVVGRAFFVSNASQLPAFRSCAGMEARGREDLTIRKPHAPGKTHASRHHREDT
jgi:hypothetical protein